MRDGRLDWHKSVCRVYLPEQRDSLFNSLDSRDLDRYPNMRTVQRIDRCAEVLTRQLLGKQPGKLRRKDESTTLEEGRIWTSALSRLSCFRLHKAVSLAHCRCLHYFRLPAAKKTTNGRLAWFPSAVYPALCNTQPHAFLRVKPFPNLLSSTATAKQLNKFNNSPL